MLNYSEAKKKKKHTKHYLSVRILKKLLLLQRYSVSTRFPSFRPMIFDPQHHWKWKNTPLFYDNMTSLFIIGRTRHTDIRTGIWSEMTGKLCFARLTKCTKLKLDRSLDSWLPATVPSPPPAWWMGSWRTSRLIESERRIWPRTRSLIGLK